MFKNLLKNNTHRGKSTRAWLEFSQTAHVGTTSVQVEKLNMAATRGPPGPRPIPGPCPPTHRSAVLLLYWVRRGPCSIPSLPGGSVAVTPSQGGLGGSSDVVAIVTGVFVGGTGFL